MIRVVKLIKEEKLYSFYITCSVYYKKDNDSSIMLEDDEANLIDYTELDGLYGFNLLSKELKDLEGNLVNLEELVKCE